MAALPVPFFKENIAQKTPTKYQKGRPVSFRGCLCKTIQDARKRRDEINLHQNEDLNIVEIEHFLDIDGRILTGSKSIDTFYEAEDRKLKGHDSGPDLHQTCICEEIATYALTEKKDALARMMAYYKALMDGHDPDEDDVPEGDVQPWKM